MSHLEAFEQLRQSVSNQIIGQQTLINRLMIALLADGHLLVEGAPGLAKTRAVKALCDGVEGDFHRVQFIPDLLPADLTGTEVYRPQDGSFQFQQGPLFHNMVLADEINRAPAKVQSALLEAMGERQITVAGHTYPLPKLFLVMATQNPIEQEGTYPLPEAQLDRFLLHVQIDYPAENEEMEILDLFHREARQNYQEIRQQTHKITQESIFAARDEILDIHISKPLQQYLVSLILATRQPAKYNNELEGWILFGASPRATIALDMCSRAHAWLVGRDFVTPEDIQSLIFDVLRHRIILRYEAQAEGVTTNQVIQKLIDSVGVP
jgi:MoxR-like ATPase